MVPRDPENEPTRTHLPGASDQAAAPAFSPPGRIGNYRLIRKLGQGGMGMVFEAEQPDPKRLVALNVISAGAFASEHSIQLFEREVQALARLKHPGIASIYEAGQTDDSQRFFTMELVAGATLNSWLAAHPLPRRELLRLFVAIGEAVTYAHQRGVIHRDLTPSNIMVLEQDGAPTIKVLDFGLARISGEDQSYVTEAGSIRGTLPYMSPEQVRGNPDAIDVRSDVYALGTILYEALTSRLPHDLTKLTFHEAARVICEELPAPLQSAVRPRGRIDEDLCTIVHKAIAQDQSGRYASVSSLADDIQRYLTDQPIQGRPPSTVYQVRKLVARHRLAFGFSVTLLALLIAFSVAVTVQGQRIARERDRANQQAETARQVSTFLAGLFSVSDPNVSRGNAVTARELLDKGSAKIDSELKGQPAVRASLLDSMGSAYDGLGLFPQAQKLAAESLDLRQRVFGPQSLEAAGSLHTLAGIAYDREDYPTAIQDERQALAIYRTRLSHDDPRIAATVTGLGNSLGATNDLPAGHPAVARSPGPRAQAGGAGRRDDGGRRPTARHEPSESSRLCLSRTAPSRSRPHLRTPRR